MRASSSQSAVALLSCVASLAVLTAGCVAQDRPHEAEFFVVADAGLSEVVAAGDPLHLSWEHNKTIEAEPGEVVHAEVEYAWRASTSDHGDQAEFNLTPTQAGLVLVELNVSAENHTASDAAAFLVLPAAVPPGGRLYVASLGDVHLESDGGSVSSAQAVHLGEFAGEHADFPLSGADPHSFHINFGDAFLDAEGSILFAVMSPPSAVHSHASPPLSLDTAFNYTLVVDTSAAQAHRVLVRNEAGTLVNNTTLSEFEAAHKSEHEVKVLVAPSGGKLPGFEGVAAASAVAVVSLVALRRRH